MLELGLKSVIPTSVVLLHVSLFLEFWSLGPIVVETTALDYFPLVTRPGTVPPGPWGVVQELEFGVSPEAAT